MTPSTTDLGGQPSAPPAELVRGAREGDSTAFTALVRQFQDMAVSYAWSLLGDFQLAEDAAQDSFIQVLGDLEGLQEPAAFGPGCAASCTSIVIGAPGGLAFRPYRWRVLWLR